MYIAKYLLSIEEFQNTKNGEALLERAFLYVDEERKRKAGCMRTGNGKASSLGAGMLLQLAMREASVATGVDVTGAVYEEIHGVKPKELPDGTAALREWQQYSVSQLMKSLCDGGQLHISAAFPSDGRDALCKLKPLPLAYVYGREGKPYFRDLPFYFNLSHSGNYVLCVLSTEEVGADIQQHCLRNRGENDSVGKLARRFFSERERIAIEEAGDEREKLFFRLWARKEAYGKMTGEGLARVMDVDMLPMARQGGRSLPGGENTCGDGMTGKDIRGKMPSGEHISLKPGEKPILWDEYDGIEGYSIAVCRYGKQHTPDYFS